MTIRKCCVFFLALTCVSSLSAQDLPQAGDIVRGLSVFDAATSMELVRGPAGMNTGTQLNHPWVSEVFVQGVQFDNLNGISHNATGNLLALNFGATPDPAMMTGGGTVYNFATQSTAGTVQVIGESASGMGGTITPTRMSSLSVSPDNTKIAIQGYDSQAIIVYDYTAGDTMGGGASLSNAAESIIDTVGTGLVGFDTQGTAWIDNDTVLTMSSLGDFWEVDVTTMSSTYVRTEPTPFVGSDQTALEYNPTISPYVYAAYSGFGGVSTNTLYVLDPANNYSLVHSIDLSDTDNGGINTMRDIALDASGNLYFTSYGGDNDDPGPYINVLLDVVTDPTSLTDNSTIEYYRSSIDSGFNAIDIALGQDSTGVDGDFDDNGVYECSDVDSLVDEIVQVAGGAAPDVSFDLTSDGNVNSDDLTAWLAEAGTALGFASPLLPGDANLDGAVDGQDFVVWNSNKFSNDNLWCGGDFNADGATDGQDFVVWNSNKFQNSDVSAVPEPAAGLLCLVGLALLIRRR